MSKTTRRTFLKSSLAAGCGLHGVRHPRPAPMVLGANNRLRIAVAGVNGRGGDHIARLAGAGQRLEIAYLIDPRRA